MVDQVTVTGQDHILRMLCAVNEHAEKTGRGTSPARYYRQYQAPECYVVTECQRS